MPSNGVSFAVTQSAIEEAKNYAMYGKDYKPDAASIAVNILTSILFGSLEAFKNNPKAVELQNRLQQGDTSAYRETADFLNRQAEDNKNTLPILDTSQVPADQPVLTAQEQAEQYINQWPEPSGVENTDIKGYNGNWDKFYEDSVKAAVGTKIPEQPKPASLSDVETRRWYLDAEAAIPGLIDRKKPLELQARQAFELRNQFRTQAREAMTNREAANILFGSKPNMTWEQAVDKYSKLGLSDDELYEEIIRAATRSNPQVNEYLNVFPK